ncbi:MAG: hypothetical protein U1F81_15570 [Verrucomicrobiaceae bacterium]
MADPVTGILRGFAEGANDPEFHRLRFRRRISYIGGDGNDVVLTILGVSVVGPNLVIESPSGSGTSNDSLGTRHQWAQSAPQRPK